MTGLLTSTHPKWRPSCATIPTIEAYLNHPQTAALRGKVTASLQYLEISGDEQPIGTSLACDLSGSATKLVCHQLADGRC